MKLHEIVEINEDVSKSILIETLLPYKRSLLAYYSDYFRSEPILMVTAVFNAAQYAKIVSADEFSEAVDKWIQGGEPEAEEDAEHERETINFNSMFLKDL